MRMPKILTLAAMAGLALFALGQSCGGSKNLCQDNNVRCEDPLTCDPLDGVCKCGGRGGTVCRENYVCDIGSVTCVPTLCANVNCSNGMSCDGTDGKCKCGGTGGKACEPGFVCDPAKKQCAGALSCAELACPKNQVCDPQTVTCKCGTATCQADETCSVGQDGAKACTQSLCATTRCAPGTACDPVDGYCKCNGVLCQSGQACACPAGSDGGACLEAERSCQVSSSCNNVSCTGGLTCDPTDGKCKCGGPGGQECGSEQICSLGPPPQCQGGAKCQKPDGGPVLCPGGTSCDPEDGTCKCGGLGGQECAAADGGDPGEVCVASSFQQACRRPCDVRSADCPNGTYCFFDSAGATPVAYCAPPSDTRQSGQSCTAPTACFEENPTRALHCNGLVTGSSGICRSYCDVTVGDSSCPQVPAHNCLQINAASAGYGYCQPT